MTNTRAIVLHVGSPGQHACRAGGEEQASCQMIGLES